MYRGKLSNLVGRTFKVNDLPEGQNLYTGIRFDDRLHVLTAWRHDLDWASMFYNSKHILWERVASDNELAMIENKRQQNLLISRNNR